MSTYGVIILVVAAIFCMQTSKSAKSFSNILGRQNPPTQVQDRQTESEIGTHGLNGTIEWQCNSIVSGMELGYIEWQWVH